MIFDWPLSLEETKQRLEKSGIENRLKSFGFTLDYIARTVWGNIHDRVHTTYDSGKANHALSIEISSIRDRVARVIRDLKLIDTALYGNTAISSDTLKRLDLTGQIERLNLLWNTLKPFEGKTVRPIKHSRDNDMLTELTNFRQWFDERSSRKNVPRLSTLDFIQLFCAPIAFNNNDSHLEPRYLGLLQKRLKERIRISRLPPSRKTSKRSAPKKNPASRRRT